MTKLGVISNLLDKKNKKGAKVTRLEAIKSISRDLGIIECNSIEELETHTQIKKEFWSYILLDWIGSGLEKESDIARQLTTFLSSVLVYTRLGVDIEQILSIKTTKLELLPIVELNETEINNVFNEPTTTTSKKKRGRPKKETVQN